MLVACIIGIEKESNSRSILKVEPTNFAHRLKVGAIWKRTRDDSKACGLGKEKN